MDALKKERLAATGIDVDGALERFMGNDALLERFLKKFLADGNYAALSAAVAAGDPAAALTASHTLKGVSGNLSMPELFGLLTSQVEALRAGDWDKAAGLMPEIDRAYESVVRAIGENS
jgi:hypothetical protein